MTKTERAIMDRLHNSPHSRTAVEFGLERGRGGTGKLRPYGLREYHAAQKLIAAGLVKVVGRDSAQAYKRGYATTHSYLILTKGDAQ